MDKKKIIGNKIKEYRKAKDLTQSELAEATGLTLSAISSYEAGFRIPRDDKKEAICRVLEVSVQDLFF